MVRAGFSCRSDRSRSKLDFRAIQSLTADITVRLHGGPRRLKSDIGIKHTPELPPGNPAGETRSCMAVHENDIHAFVVPGVGGLKARIKTVWGLIRAGITRP